MLKRLIVVGLLLAFAPVANAGLIDIEVVPSMAPPISGMYYAGGETFSVGLTLADTGAGEIVVRGLQFDFSQSDAALTFDAAFNFDGLPFGGLAYTKQAAMDYPSAAFPQPEPPQGNMGLLIIPAGGSVYAGQVGVTLPAAPGTYMLDALTVDPTGAGLPTNWGAWVRHDFDVPTQIWAGDGGVTGGMMSFTVIPEPATLALLAIGGVAVLRRRR